MSCNLNKDLSEGTEMVTMDELRLASTSDSPRKPIKSTAVVKYSAVQAPACFEQLRCNTDLNQPPSNWLSTKSCGGIHHGLSTNSGFSSFRMAHMFPDCVGEVDVVSDAENIKKLLKIPYSKGPVSMMVHRVENTLLIDEFDIHKHLLRAAESDWVWLRRFFFDHVLANLSGKANGLCQKNLSRDALQQRSLISKFLYHSLAEGGEVESDSVPSTPLHLSPPAAPPPAETLHWNTLPEPRLELPDHKSNHEFARNVVWTFEDIQMLIGTDMPIFGGRTHPCISLRLRDMKRPISVLTGIDYWLDNLMCNVPEVVMCYHLDGIVQRYELVKTEDLPHLADSKFSPKLIHDVAQNILSFLKSNATKAGHTYWLFKGKDDDAVKLYDLTSLCSDEMEEKEHNPFTVPVAMLIYRVARNMKQQGSKQHGCIRMLLENCISLLDKDKYPQIVTSAHYMLSDLYVPADTNPSSPEFPEDEEDEDEGEDGGEGERREEERGEVESTGETSVEVQSLYLANPCHAVQNKCRPPLLSGTTIERCRQSLDHISEGLACLRCLDSRMWHPKPDTPQEEETPKMAHPFQAIPMPFTSTPKETMAVLTPPKKEVIHGPKTENDWAGHLLTLLYEKALLVLAILAQDSLASENFGAALRQVKSILILSKGLEKLSELLGIKHGKGAEVAAMRSFLLGQTGDACCMVVQHWSNVEEYRADLAAADSSVDYILEQLALDVGAEQGVWPVCAGLESMCSVLRSGVACYKLALTSHPSPEQEASLRRRLGNVHNELGVLYMSQANSKLTEGPEGRSQFESLVKQSLAQLEAGISSFESVADSGNLALLLTNSGRLMRLCAHALTPENRTPLEGQERIYYNKALSYYQRALYTLGARKASAAIWDSVTWELSTTLFNMAAILQDFPNCQDKSQEELEKEVGEALQRALTACDMDTPGPRLPMYQFRAATIHHRLASLHHKSFRLQGPEDSRRKFSLQLCRLHYEKAAEMFRALEDASEFLRVQLERVALTEFIADGSTGVSAKRKSLHAGLELILSCEAMVGSLTSSEGGEEEGRLLNLLEQRLQSLLLTLAKLTTPSVNPKNKHKESTPAPPYKGMYALTLHRATSQTEDVASVAARLTVELRKLSELLNKQSVK